MLNRFLRLKTLVAAASTVALVVVPSAAQAQLPIDHTATPKVINPPLLDWMSYLILGLAVLACLLIGLLYARYAPRFRRSEADDPAFLRPGIPAQNVQIGGVASRAPAPAPAQTVAVGAPVAAAAVSTPAAPAAPAPAAAAPATPGEAAPATAEAPTGEAPVAETAAPAGAPAKKVEAELDQETFDRVLQEQLDKGVDRRVAEGRAKSKAVQAARAKAGS